MKALWTAIINRSSGSTFSSNVGKRIYAGQAPQKTSFPFCVFHQLPGEVEYVSRARYETIPIQFSIYTQESSPSNIGTYADNLKSRFDDCTLAVSGYHFGKMERQNPGVILPDQKEGIWHYAIDYDVLLRKVST